MSTSKTHLVCLGLAITVLTGSLSTAVAQPSDDLVEAKLQRELDETVNPLEPGEYRWYPDISPTGPVVILVSIPDQLVKVYRNGIRIGISTVSTGKTGHETPTGVFHILEKDKDHVSNLFKGAAMPNMQRLTWTGIALHAGNLPGYPASHGCIRMPLDFSALLFDITGKGGTVVVADELSAPQTVAHAGLVLPSTEVAALEADQPAEEATADIVWNPDAVTEGPIGIVVSSADERAHIYRNGTLIGNVPIAISDPELPLPAGVSIVLEGFSDEPNPFAPELPMPLWMAVALPTGTAHADYHSEIVGRIRANPRIGTQVFSMLQPGDSLVVTNLPLSVETTTEHDFVIAASELPEELQEQLD